MLQKYEEIFKQRLAIVPYVMPGFDLSIAASKAYEEAKELAINSNQELEGCLINHGLFTFGESAKLIIRMINIVQEVDKFLNRKIHLEFKNENEESNHALRVLPYLRGLLGLIKKYSFNDKWI